MDPILFQTGLFELPAYRVFLALGGILFFLGLKFFAKELGLRQKQDFWLLVNLIAIGGFIGARLMFVLLETPAMAGNFWQQLFSIHSGFSIFGFFAGSFTGAWLGCRILKLEASRILDGISLFLPLWLICARIGCFLNGCCCGTPANVPWAVTFTDHHSAVPAGLLNVPLHPAQLYEAAGELLIMTALFAIWPYVRRGQIPRGLVFATFLCAYGALRFILEWFRADTKPFLNLITVGQALALGLIALGIFFGIVCRRRSEFPQINHPVELKTS